MLGLVPVSHEAMAAGAKGGLCLDSLGGISSRETADRTLFVLWEARDDFSADFFALEQGIFPSVFGLLYKRSHSVGVFFGVLSILSCLVSLCLF